MKKLVILAFLAILSEACSTVTSPKYSVTPFETSIATETKLSGTQTPTISNRTNTPDGTVFRIITINPTDRVTSISELGLSPTTRVLVFDAKDEQFLSLSENSAIKIPNVRPEANYHLESVKLSPDHQQFAYLEIKDGFNFWVSSIDGLSSAEVQHNAIGSSYLWLNNDQIAIYNNPGLWMDCPSELHIVSIDSSSVNDMSDEVPGGNSSCFPIPYFNADFSRGIYLRNSKGWEMYDYASKTAQFVLLGLDTSPDINKYFFHWADNGLTFAIPESDKITFAQDLVDVNLISSNPPFKVISLPPDTVNKNSVFDFWDPNKQFAGFDLVAENTERVLDCNIQQTFVVVDLLAQELRNYCLSREVFNGEVGTVWATYISADNRFVGWTIRGLPSNDKPLGTVILSVQTGNVAYLPDYELLGFGEVNQ